MLRKWMAMLMTLLMIVMMPFGAMADTQHTLSIIPGDAMAADQAVVDLLDVLALRLTEGERSGALTVLLNDSEIVTVGMTADAGGLYAGSEVFGEDILYITWDDLFVLAGSAMEASLAEMGTEGEAVKQAMIESLTELRASLTLAFEESNEQLLIIEGIETEQLLELDPELFGNDPKMIEFVDSINGKLVVEDGSFTAENRDAADQKMTLTMDKSDFLLLCETEYMNNSIREALQQQVPEATEEELAAYMDEVMVEVKKLLEEGEFAVDMTAYTLEEGAVIVGMDMTMNMVMNMEAGNGSQQATSMQMNAVYDRLTENGAADHEAEIVLAADGEKVEMLLVVDNDAAAPAKGMFGMLFGGEEIVVTYTGETEAEKNTRTFELFLRSGANAILEPAASARPVIGVVIISEPAPEDVLAALENASVSTSTNVMTLSEAETNELMNTISSNGMTVFFKLLSELPSSVMQQMMAQ